MLRGWQLTLVMAIALLNQTGVSGQSGAEGAASFEKIIAGYVFPNGASLQADQVQARELTRINYAFANIEGGRAVEGSPVDRANLAVLNTLRQQNPNLTILISVGGWAWSKHFSDVALTAESRSVFIESCIELLKRNSLDGIDLDWEYPGMAGAGNPFRAADKANFTLLLKELRQALDEEAAKTHHKLYLTIAAAASEEFLDHTEMGSAQAYVDAVNVMAYDYYEPDSDHLTGNHAPLFLDPADPRKASADATVRAFEKAGVPASKIVLGVPFYGHVWSGVAAQNHGLFQAGSKAHSPYVPYQAIIASMLNHGFVRYWDEAAHVPTLYNAETHVFVSYEDAESLAAKCAYVRGNRLGGVMFWEYGNDPSGALLKVIHGSLSKP